jgi:hypothetical protein
MVSKYAEWNKLPRDAQLAAIADAAAHSDDPTLKYQAIELYIQRASTIGERSKALEFIKQTAQDKANPERAFAIMKGNYLLRVGEDNRISSQVLDLYDEGLSDPSMTRNDVSNLLSNLSNQAALSRTMRIRVIKIIDHYMATTTDKRLRAMAIDAKRQARRVRLSTTITIYE